MRPILRKVDAGYDYSFSVREDIYPHLYNHWHYHPEAELTLIRKGKGIRLVGDSIERFEDGDLVLIGKDIPHLWRNDEIYFQGLPGLQAEAVAVHFNEDFWGSCFLELPEMKAIRDLLLKAKRGLRITGSTKQIIASQMESILSASGTQRIGHLLNMLDLIAVSRDYEPLSSVGFSKHYDLLNTDKINRIYTYTFNNFQKKITLREAAGTINISPHSFCRYFRSRTLKTYGQFVLEVRVGYACKLLIENKMSVARIGFACGFNNLSNFNRHFKSLVGTTPLQYAKKYTQYASPQLKRRSNKTQ